MLNIEEKEDEIISKRTDKITNHKFNKIKI